VQVLVEGFTIKAIDGTLDVGLGRRPLAAEVELDPLPAAQRQLSRPELVFQHNLTQGIRPDEGKRMAARVLTAHDRAVTYVSSMDLAGLRAQTDELAAAQTRPSGGDASAVFARPDLDAEYVAPRSDLEESLVAIWQELLGINEIGVRDSFFDLGGHSLIAVRLFARVRKLFSVDFPISVLFEAPTVEACARLIADAMPAPADGETDEPATDGTIVASQPRFRHLVAMHPGEGGSKSPFFLVAGMFGNVLNLRHLAHLIGTDRPFYGVQAKGLFGGEDPHDDFREMAAAYLEEVRQVQPEGPYLLGGFSGGGITAFEMAQQLHAVGEEVGILVFLDTIPPSGPTLNAVERARIQRDRLAQQGIGYVKEWAVNRVRWELERRHRAKHGPELPTEDGALHSTAIEAAFYRALDAYEVKPYAGTITLYRPRLNPVHVFGPDRLANADRRLLFHDNGWGELCEHIDVSEVPGDHDRMVLEPSVRVLADRLRAALDEAEATAGAARSSAGVS
jgi:thioesterase domain-containing protein/acyl carrier protein